MFSDSQLEKTLRGLALVDQSLGSRKNTTSSKTGHNGLIYSPCFLTLGFLPREGLLSALFVSFSDRDNLYQANRLLAGAGGGMI